MTAAQLTLTCYFSQNQATLPFTYSLLYFTLAGIRNLLFFNLHNNEIRLTRHRTNFQEKKLKNKIVRGNCVSFCHFALLLS